MAHVSICHYGLIASFNTPTNTHSHTCACLLWFSFFNTPDKFRLVHMAHDLQMQLQRIGYGIAPNEFAGESDVAVWRIHSTILETTLSRHIECTREYNVSVTINCTSSFMNITHFVFMLLFSVILSGSMFPHSTLVEILIFPTQNWYDTVI